MVKKRVIVIGGEHAQWPITNAEWIAKAGFEAKVLFFSNCPAARTPINAELIRKPIHYNWIDKAMIASWIAISGLLALLSWPHFRKMTGRNPMLSDLCPANNPISARKKANIINQLNPDIVVGHNISLSGSTVAKCVAKRKILIGWSGDMSEAFHCSPLQHSVFTHIVSHTNLFIAASETALRIFKDEFSINDERLLRTAWQNKNISELLNYNHDHADEIRAKFGIPNTAKIIFHARRFKSQYCAMQGFKACVEIARKRDNVWAVFIEGYANEKYFERAMRELKNEPKAIAKRFIMLKGEVPFDTILNIFSISTIFLSLRKKGDMRSATVIQGAAMGSIPVLPIYSEWELMKKCGFNGFLVNPDNHAALVDTIIAALNTDKKLVVQKNREYLKTHESDAVYFERFSKALWELVDQKK